jgi:hypothetical protein
MARPRKAWSIPPAKNRASVTATTKTDVEAKAADLIEKVLKPKHVLPPPVEAEFNYVSDIGTRWHGNYFYFIATYTCPRPMRWTPLSRPLSTIS